MSIVQGYIDGKMIVLSPSKTIGKGGEADVYDIGSGLAAKIFKLSGHIDYTGSPNEQQAARDRIDEHQRKLPAFPRNLPPRVIVPKKLITDQAGKRIVGYAMRLLRGTDVLLRYSDRSFREAGIKNETVVSIFRDLHSTVGGIHQAGAAIGDFNDLNVLASDTEAYIIDADSFQFEQYLCKVFTARFVDPLLCDSHKNNPVLCRPHTADSDWYAFAIMLMQCLLFVDPYGGVYRPKDPSKRIPHTARPMNRITVFDPEVRYPKPAISYDVLPDDLLQRFHLIFEKDERGVFPLVLLEEIRWTKCSSCGIEHARGICPSCAHVAEAAIKEVTIVRGKVRATSIFRTTGTILFAAYQGNKLNWLYHEKSQFKREGGLVVAKGELDPQTRYRLCGEKTLMAKDGRLITLSLGESPDKLLVDNYQRLPVFDANELSRYWTHSGQLLRDGQYGSKYIGDVLENQTLFWVGPNFGFGFYRAGNLSVSFVFDARKSGINDSVKLSPIKGQLVDSTCVFSKDRCWFFHQVNILGERVNSCSVIHSDGSVEATAEAPDGDGTWLGTIRGKCAAGNFLLCATDDGIVKVEPNNGHITVTKEYPDTEPFVDSQSNLFPGSEGLYVARRREIIRLTIS